MDSTSVTLLERIRSTDDDVAWQRFIVIYTPLLAYWAKRAGLTDADTADVVQDVLLKVLKLLPSFQYDRTRKNFRGFLKTIVVNDIRDRRRKKLPVTGGDPEPEIDESDAAWNDEYTHHVTVQALRVMQSDFEANTWRACWETTANERSAKEVAAELNMTEASVYTAKSRVLRRLREELKGLME